MAMIDSIACGVSIFGGILAIGRVVYVAVSRSEVASEFQRAMANGDLDGVKSLLAVYSHRVNQKQLYNIKNWVYEVESGEILKVKRPCPRCERLMEFHFRNTNPMFTIINDVPVQDSCSRSK